MIYKVKSVFIQTHKSIFTYIIVIISTLLFVLLSNPFLRYPYDIFAHLITIDELYHGKSITTGIPSSRLIWHNTWVMIFHFFNIDSQQLFLRAKIIYTIQTLITLFSIYFFSNVLFRNLFKQINKQTLLYLSTWSTIIWLTIFATHSVHYHLVWNLWYSVNYQISLALFWYITGLTLILILEKISWNKKLFFIVQIIFISLFILQIHSMELMYYFMYVTLLSFIYIDKLYTKLKKYYYILIPIFILLSYGITQYQTESSKIFQYFTLQKFPLLYNNILTTGEQILKYLNRANNGSINELMILLYYFSLFMILQFLWNFIKKEKTINHRLLIFIFLSTSFIFIPLFQFSSGLFGLITRPDVVHRIYYSSSLFILLPLFIYILLYTYRIPLKYLNPIILSILVSIFYFSKYDTQAPHFYYKNIQSIQNSFYPNIYNFHLKHKHIKIIEKKIKEYEEKNNSNKKIYFYARTDIAFMLKYMYRKNVYWEKRRANPNHIKAYQEKKKNNYHNILFETPKNFPKYIPFL